MWAARCGQPDVGSSRLMFVLTVVLRFDQRAAGLWPRHLGGCIYSAVSCSQSCVRCLAVVVTALIVLCIKTRHIYEGVCHNL